MKECPEWLKPPSAKKQIFRILLILLTSLVFGFAIVGWAVYHYTWHKTFKASELLVSPSRLETNGSHFQLITLTMIDPDSRQMNKKNFSLQLYSQFYDTFKRDRSERVTSEEMERKFANGTLTQMIIKVPLSLVGSSKNISLEVDFNPKQDLYRISYGSMPEVSYAYFQHPNLAAHLKGLFDE